MIKLKLGNSSQQRLCFSFSDAGEFRICRPLFSLLQSLPPSAVTRGLPTELNGAYGMTEVPYNEGTPMTSAGVTGGIFGDPLYPFDSQYPWQHGYFQEISPYSGYHYFKPYNYRHVLSQTQTATGWGITPQLSYSQHFWNRYHEQAAWKNYALPPREEDIEEIQKRKREFQEKRIDENIFILLINLSVP